MFPRSMAAWAALAGLAWSQPAEPVRLPDLIATALANNPEITAAQKRYEAARQRPAQERSLPDPRLAVGYNSVGGPLPGQGLGTQPTANIGVMLSQELPYPGKRKLRGEIAGKEADAEFQQYLAVELNIRARVTQAYHRLHHAVSAIEILNRGKELVGQVIRVSEVRYSAGKAAQTDILKAQTELALLEIRIVQMQQDRRTAEAELNALLNRKPGTPIGEPDDAPSLPLPFTLEELLARTADTAPELRRDEKMMQRGELAVNLARKEFHPDYTVSAGYYNMGGMPPMFEFRLEIPLRVHSASKQKPAVDEQVFRLGEARRNYEAAGQNLQFRVREAYAAAETAFRLMNLYSDTILPQSGLTVESSLAGYQTGSTDFLSVLSNVITRIDSEERYHEQKLNYALAEARLEELTGITLDAPAGGPK